jgi:hypothetical protein
MATIQFDRDDQNIGHLALHQISPAEAEQVVLNRPVDLESEFATARSEFPKSVKRMPDEF